MALIDTRENAAIENMDECEVASRVISILSRWEFSTGFSQEQTRRNWLRQFIWMDDMNERISRLEHICLGQEREILELKAEINSMKPEK